MPYKNCQGDTTRYTLYAPLPAANENRCAFNPSLSLCQRIKVMCAKVWFFSKPTNQVWVLIYARLTLNALTIVSLSAFSEQEPCLTVTDWICSPFSTHCTLRSSLWFTRVVVESWWWWDDVLVCLLCWQQIHPVRSLNASLCTHLFLVSFACWLTNNNNNSISL